MIYYITFLMFVSVRFAVYIILEKITNVSIYLSCYRVVSVNVEQITFKDYFSFSGQYLNSDSISLKLSNIWQDSVKRYGHFQSKYNL